MQPGAPIEPLRMSQDKEEQSTLEKAGASSIRLASLRPSDPSFSSVKKEYIWGAEIQKSASKPRGSTGPSGSCRHSTLAVLAFRIHEGGWW